MNKKKISCWQIVVVLKKIFGICCYRNMIHFGIPQQWRCVLSLPYSCFWIIFPRTTVPFCELKWRTLAHVHKTDKYEHDLTWELMMRMVVLFPTSLSYPLVGAELNLRTASWESRKAKAI